MSSSANLVVAIDGPSASGKSTVSKCVAKELGFIYVDSGSLYRGITWKVIQEGLDCEDADVVNRMIGRMDVVFFVENHVVRFRIDGVDPSPELRSDAVVERVSDVAAMLDVRTFVNHELRSMVRYGRIVVEGRDIGSVVFPNALFKYYLDADPNERARRRHQEMANETSLDERHIVLDSLKRRDYKDTTRRIAPLQIPDGARVVNTTSLNIEEVVSQIVADIREVGVGE